MTKKEILNRIKCFFENLPSRDSYREYTINNPDLPSEFAIKKAFGSFKELRNYWDNPDKLNQNNSVPSDIIVEAEDVIYNKSTEDYVFDFTKVSNIAKPITIKKNQLFAILQDYSNFDGNPKTVSEIALKHKIPPFILEKIFHKLRFRHASLPITNAYISENNDEEKVVEDLAAIKRFNIAEKFNHQQWKEIQTNAQKWLMFEQCVFNPIKDILSTVQLPKVILDKSELVEELPLNNENEAFIVTLSDIHFGAFTDSRNCFYTDKDWTIEDTQKAVDSYIYQIEQELENMLVRPSDCIVLSCGDILHSITGFTDKGTQLIVNPKGVSQFKIALESISYFLTRLVILWKDTGTRIQVKAVSGNHDSFGDWVLFTCLEQMFKKVMDFDIASSRWLLFQYGENACVVEHGYSAKYNSKVPQDDKSKENYVQKLLLEKITQLNLPINNRYFFMGDRHHYNQKEMSSFEFIQLPTLVPSDEYADNLNLSGRARQMCFVMDKKKGITKTFNFYIDGKK